MTENIRIIFIHGNGGNDWRFAWTPWLKSELEKLNLDVIFETFPDPTLARKQYWMPHLKNKLKVDKNTLLIGWSSGAVAAMRYAEENKIFSSILISPCYTDLEIESEKISGWYEGKWKWNNILENQKLISMFYSKNDEFIPMEEFEHIKKKLEIKDFFEFKDSGHFINQNTFPEVLEYVKKILKI